MLMFFLLIAGAVGEVLRSVEMSVLKTVPQNYVVPAPSVKMSGDTLEMDGNSLVVSASLSLSEPAFAAVLLTALVTGPESASTQDEAKQLRPLDAPSSFMVPLRKHDGNDVFYTIINEETIMSTLLLGQTSYAVKLEVLVDGAQRHTVGKVMISKDKKKREPKPTEVVQHSNGQYSRVTKRQLFWHTLPEIRHKNPPPPKYQATVASTLVTFIAAAAPILTFFSLLKHTGVMRNVSYKNLSAPACAFLSLVFSSAGLLVAYWTVLDLFMFLGIVIWLIPPAVLVVHHAFSRFREHGRLCIAAPVLE